MPDSHPPLHVITFVTKSGGCCCYATLAPRLADGSEAPIRLPPQVRAQLDAIGARVAWWYVATHEPLRVPGEAAHECSPIVSATPENVGRLVFL